MQLLFLLKTELIREYSKFRLSLKDNKILASYLIFGVSILITSTGLYTFLYRLINLDNKIILNNNASFIIQEILPLILRSWIVLNIFKVTYTSYLARWFDSSDIDLLYCAPIQPNELFLSKYIKTFLKHVLILVIFFITINPILLYLNMSSNIFILFFITLLLFIEIIYLISISIFFILKNSTSNNKFSFKKYDILILGIFIFSYFLLLNINYITSIEYIYMNFPSTITINIFISLIKNLVSVKLMINFIKLFLIYLLLIFLIYSLNSNYYEYVFNNLKKSEKKRYNYFIYNIPFSVFIYKINYLTLTMKDILIYIRENFIEFISYLSINYSFMLIIFQRNFYNNFKLTIHNNNSLFFLIVPFILIIVLTMNTVSIESFNSESKKIWILKSSNNPYNKIIKEKFLYGLTINLILNIPIYLLIIQLINTILNKIMMIVVIIEIILIHNVIGTLISATHSSILEKNKKLPLISNFTQLVATIMVSSTSLFLINLKPIYLYLIDIILISVLITKYDKPLLYYFINITSTIYVISIIAFLSLSLILLSSLVIRSILLSNYYLDFSSAIAYIVAILLKMAIITRVCLKSTEDAFRENENLI